MKCELKIVRGKMVCKTHKLSWYSTEHLEQVIMEAKGNG
jgi:hypothetical protein